MFHQNLKLHTKTNKIQNGYKYNVDKYQFNINKILKTPKKKMFIGQLTQPIGDEHVLLLQWPLNLF